jgi:hypothetical protein
MYLQIGPSLHLDPNMHRSIKPETILPFLSLYDDRSHAILVLYSKSFVVKDTTCARTDGARSVNFVVWHWIFSIFCGIDDCLSFYSSYHDDPHELSHIRWHENWQDVPHAVRFNQ